MPPPILRFELNGTQYEIDFHYKNGKSGKTLFDRIHYDDLKFLLGFNQEVRSYFEKRKYNGFESSFEVDKIEASSLGNKTMLVRLRGLTKKITQRDKDWEDGLIEIGQKFGVLLLIPEEHYELSRP